MMQHERGICERIRRLVWVPWLAAWCVGCYPEPVTVSGEGGPTGLVAAEKRLVLDLTSAPVIPTPEPILELLEAELKRSLVELKKAPAAPYFLGYAVSESDAWSIAAGDGAVLQSGRDRARILDVEVRIGTRRVDSSHRLPGEQAGDDYLAPVMLPLEDVGGPLRNAVWLATVDRYETARRRFMRVQGSQDRDTSPDKKPRADDFSSETPVRRFEQPVILTIDAAAWEAKLAEVSARAVAFPEILHSSVTLEVSSETRYLVNSEGSAVQLTRPHIRLGMNAEAVASDGLPIEQFATIEATELSQIPDVAELGRRFETLLQEVQALLKAPMVDPYVGPAILDGRAAGVFFHEVFGHRIEGHRQDDESEGQTFATRVGKPVMPSNLNVFDDPRIRRINGIELNGNYAVDDEAVPAQRVDLVTAGVLRTFLLSRAPARGFARSNGHGRRSPAHPIVARQANLVVDPSVTVAPDQLKQALLREVNRQRLPFGLRFTEITGGYTKTQRFDTQAFKVIPVLVFRVYPDGREELVRGVDIEGTPLTVLSKIIAAGNDFQVFNGVCGAESGWVPVSATSPSLLLSQIEVARQELTELRPPILPDPGAEAQRVNTPRLNAPARPAGGGVK
jgi:TldD protein